MFRGSNQPQNTNKHWGVTQMYGCPGRCNHECGVPFVSVDWRQVQHHMVDCCDYIFSLHSPTDLKDKVCALGQPTCIVPGHGYEDYRRATETSPSLQNNRAGGVSSLVAQKRNSAVSQPLVPAQPLVLLPSPQQAQTVTQTNASGAAEAKAKAHPQKKEAPTFIQRRTAAEAGGGTIVESEEEEVELPLDREEEERYASERQKQHRSFRRASQTTGGKKEPAQENKAKTRGTTSPKESGKIETRGNGQVAKRAPKKTESAQQEKKPPPPATSAKKTSGSRSRKRSAHESTTPIVYGCPQCLENQKNGKLGEGQKPFITDRWLTLKRHLYFCTPEIFKQHETTYIKDKLCQLKAPPPDCEAFSSINEHADDSFLEYEKSRMESKRQRQLSRIREQQESGASAGKESEEPAADESAEAQKRPSQVALRRRVAKHKAEGRKRWSVHNHLLDGNKEPYMKITDEEAHCNDANAALRRALEHYFEQSGDPFGVQAAMGSKLQWIHWACQVAVYQERTQQLSAELKKDKDSHKNTLAALGKTLQRGNQGSREFVFALHCIFQDTFIRCHLPRPPLLDLAFGMSLNTTSSSANGRDDYARRMKAFKGYASRTFEVVQLVCDNPLDPNLHQDKSETLPSIIPLEQRPQNNESEQRPQTGAKTKVDEDNPTMSPVIQHVKTETARSDTKK